LLARDLKAMGLPLPQGALEEAANYDALYQMARCPDWSLPVRETDARKMKGFAEAIESYRQRVEKARRVYDALDRYLAARFSKLGGDLAVLFGSYADGSLDLRSDVDLVLVGSAFPKDRSNRAHLVCDADFPERLQILAYRPEELLRLVGDDDVLAREALTTRQIPNVDAGYPDQLLAVLSGQ